MWFLGNDIGIVQWLRKKNQKPTNRILGRITLYQLELLKMIGSNRISICLKSKVGYRPPQMGSFWRVFPNNFRLIRIDSLEPWPLPCIIGLMSSSIPLCKTLGNLPLLMKINLLLAFEPPGPWRVSHLGSCFRVAHCLGSHMEGQLRTHDCWCIQNWCWSIVNGLWLRSPPRGWSMTHLTMVDYCEWLLINDL